MINIDEACALEAATSKYREVYNNKLSEGYTKSSSMNKAWKAALIKYYSKYRKEECSANSKNR